MALPEKDMATG